MYDYIFIDSGSPDSYLSADVGSIGNETFFNESANAFANTTDLGPVPASINGTADEPLADVIVMAITSLVLGLMILVTVIGKPRSGRDRERERRRERKVKGRQSRVVIKNETDQHCVRPQLNCRAMSREWPAPRVTVLFHSCVRICVLSVRLK